MWILVQTVRCSCFQGSSRCSSYHHIMQANMIIQVLFKYTNFMQHYRRTNQQLRHSEVHFTLKNIALNAKIIQIGSISEPFGACSLYVLVYEAECVCVCLCRGRGGIWSGQLSSACVHSTSSPPLLTVSGCLKHSCQWSSVSPPIHPQSCLLCNYSSPGFCSAPNLEAALWSARARPSFGGPEFTRSGSPSPPTHPFFFSHWPPEVCWSTKPWKGHN